VQKGGKITHLLRLSRDLVSRSTMTQIASFPLFPLGSPNTKSIVIISHFHSGIGNGCNQGCQFCFGRCFVFSIGMECFSFEVFRRAVSGLYCLYIYIYIYIVLNKKQSSVRGVVIPENDLKDRVTGFQPIYWFYKKNKNKEKKNINKQISDANEQGKTNNVRILDQTQSILKYNKNKKNKNRYNKM